jgi:hypothetical protein
VPHSRHYRLQPQGYTISPVFLKLFERICAPLTPGLLAVMRSYHSSGVRNSTVYISASWMIWTS